MPKVNVYLSDDLAEAVKQAGIPVSSVCQRALEGALRASMALRSGTQQAPGDLPDDVELPAVATPRLAAAIKLAYKAAYDLGHADVTTGHLLVGMIDEGANLGLKVVTSMDIEVADLRTELAASVAGTKAGGAKDKAKLDPPARQALAAMVEEAVRLGHNYLGCEHLLLAIVVEPDGPGGKVLRSMGVDITVARRTVTTALTGFIHARANPVPDAPPWEKVVMELAERLRRIEEAVTGAK